MIDNRANDLVRLDIRINGDDAPPLASICHKESAHSLGKGVTEKLKELIPRQQIPVKIQACIGVKPVASSVISPMRKDVLAKCYGKHMLLITKAIFFIRSVFISHAPRLLNTMIHRWRY